VPRHGLTAERVVEAAAELADRDGLAALTLAALAAGLDVRVPSLYKHIEGLPDLIRRLAVRAAGDLADALSLAGGGLTGELTGREALTAYATTYRRWAVAHPGQYAALFSTTGSSLVAPEPGAAEALTDDLRRALLRVEALSLEVLARYGRTDGAALGAARGMWAALHGYLVLPRPAGLRAAPPQAVAGPSRSEVGDQPVDAEPVDAEPVDAELVALLELLDHGLSAGAPATAGNRRGPFRLPGLSSLPGLPALPGLSGLPGLANIPGLPGRPGRGTAPER
jgi:AcrR family transcriptional regulator